jgi:asparagine synthase (glutamine-hydrolysing)
MCGIGGQIAPGGVSLRRVAAMSDALAHRGPDDEGFVVLGAGGAFAPARGDDTVAELGGLPHWKSLPDGGHRAALFHRRLSILDLSPAGHEPMLTVDGRLALVFNGEIYNYLELAAELEPLGHRLADSGDAAVLLAAFAEWGPGCVHRLRGMWAFAVYDREARRLTLSRDRFGIKPLYYTRAGGAFAFASEIKGLLPALGGSPRGSESAAARFLAWGDVDDDESTLFEGVFSLPAGTTLHVDADDLAARAERYYEVGGPTDIFDGSLDDAVAEYGERFRKAVALHMRSDVQVGSCLSGGLDSGLIVSTVKELAPAAPLATFSAVYDDPAVDERRFIELYDRAHFEMRFVSPTADGLSASLTSFVRAQDQPVMSSSPFAQWEVMRLAGEHGIKVLLDGQGADEPIGGYSYFAGVHVLDLIRRGRLAHAGKAALLLRERRGINPAREVGRAAFHQLPSFLRGAARRFTRPGYRLVAAGGGGSADRHEPRLRSFADYCRDALRRSLPELLRYEDRSSMAFSIESRVPYLDHPLVEFVLSLPADFKIDDGWSKLVQRRAAEPLVPSQVVWRRDKLGFATPQRAWRRALLPQVRELLAGSRVPAFLDRLQLERLVESDPKRPIDQAEFWKAALFLAWMDAYDVRYS